jgi:hypothetical protein
VTSGERLPEGTKIRMHVAWCAFCTQRVPPARDVGEAPDEQLRRLAHRAFVVLTKVDDPHLGPRLQAELYSDRRSGSIQHLYWLM